MPIDAISVLCAQLTRDLLAIAKFLFCLSRVVVGGLNWLQVTFLLHVKYTVGLSYRIVYRVVSYICYDTDRVYRCFFLVFHAYD